MAFISTLKLVGLGNLGMEETRHSVGMMAVNHMAKVLDANWKKALDMKALVATCTFPKQPIELVLVKSMYNMNLNGRSVSKAAKSFAIIPEHIYLLQDDLDLGLGKHKIKERGSAGGHNGVKSCIECLQSMEMKRLKIGISRPSTRLEIQQYVLKEFTTQEYVLIEKTISNAITDVLEHIKRQEGRKAIKNEE